MIEKLAQLLGENDKIYPHKTEEKYPRIVEKIVALWGLAGMPRYFSELLFDDRGGRAGFPPEVMMEIFALSNFYETIKPTRPAETRWKSTDLDRLDRFGVTKS